MTTNTNPLFLEPGDDLDGLEVVVRTPEHAAPDHAAPEPEPMVLAQPELLLPEGQRFWTDDSMFFEDKNGLLSPHFSVQEVSKVFFGNGADWLRWRMRPDDRKVKDPETGEWKRNEDGSYVMEKGDYPDGYFVLDGEPMTFKRTKAGSRYFTLADIERMGHALAQGGHIDGAQLTNIVVLVKTVAKVYGITA
jgi:hypothetical protein